jgi:hypothetical protein
MDTKTAREFKEAYKSIYSTKTQNEECVVESDNLYDSVCTYLLEEEGCTLEEANYVMTYIVEQGMNPLQIFTAGLGNMLFPQKKGTPSQGSLLTKKGTAQNFRGGRQPFTSTDPIKQGRRSELPKPTTKPQTSSGQMKIPGLSNRAQDIRNITRNPSAGLPGTPGGVTMSGSKTSPTRPPAPNLPSPYGRTPAPKPTPTSKQTPNRYRPGATVRATGPNLDKYPNLARFANRPNPLPSAKSAISTAAQVSRLATPTGVAAAVLKPTKLGDGSLTAAKARGDYTGPLPSGTRSVNKYNTRDADGTIRSRLKVGPAKVGTEAQSFDRAFANARKSGQKQFTWKGKSYTTQTK